MKAANFRSKSHDFINISSFSTKTYNFSRKRKNTISFLMAAVGEGLLFWFISLFFAFVSCYWYSLMFILSVCPFSAALLLDQTFT